jgi:hypothetical protein
MQSEMGARQLSDWSMVAMAPFFRTIVAAISSTRFQLETTGVSGHSARPDRAPSADTCSCGGAASRASAPMVVPFSRPYSNHNGHLRR